MPSVALFARHKVSEISFVVSWNAPIIGFAQNGQGQFGLDCLEQMQREGILLDEVTLGCLPGICKGIDALPLGCIPRRSVYV